MRTHALMIVAIGLLIAAEAPNEDRAKAEMKKLEGTWRLSAIGDREVPKEADSLMVFKGDQYTITFKNELDGKGTYKVDPSKSPKWLDLLHTEGEHKGKTRQGIYEFDGDTLKVCFDDWGKPRPTEFKMLPRTSQITLVYKRETKNEGR